MNLQQKWSRAFDQAILPSFFLVDGNRDYVTQVVPRYLRPSLVVWDIGGGKRPLITEEIKTQLGLKLVGLDVDSNELNRAPAGLYDETICADITEYAGDGQADLVICQALLEHVRDAEKALSAIASCLKSGGRALLFIPSRNAVYARINLLIPERLKLWIIQKLMPESAQMRGFKAYYDRCTPRQFRAMADRCGFEVEELKCYYISSYFSYFFPVYVLWRLWICLFYFFDRENAAETFTFGLKKR